MKSLKELFNELQVSAHELKGALAWLSILAATDLIVLNWPSNDEIPSEVWKPWADSLKLKRNVQPNYRYKPNYSKPKSNAQGFPFDPMTVTADSLVLLGVKPWIATRIIKYRNSGGQFRRKEDFDRIYGLREADKELLQHNARFSRSIPALEFNRSNLPDETARRMPVASKNVRILSLNHADSAAWERLPDIGPVLASRIVKYRNKLGGFVRREQLLEVFGLDTAVYMKIAPQLEMSSSPNQLLDWINADRETLGKHPYIGRYIASKIIRYREQNKHVPERMSPEKWLFLDSLKLEKLKPYLSKP